VRGLRAGGGEMTQALTIAAAAPPLGVALGSPSLETCAISIQGFTGTTVDVAYSGLPGNQPKDYGNFVAIWDGSVIPWQATPMRQMPIPDNMQSGTLVIGDVAITSSTYTVGYGVGPAIPTVCAAATLAAGGLATPEMAVTIAVTNIGTTSLSVHYHTLSGYLPATNKNWIGLWTGSITPYGPPKPLASQPITDDVTDGDVGINGVVLTIDTTYTLVYFMGAATTTAAALLTFTTSGA
jgi:hypothetical protein